ncbi:MAG: GTP-binding protein, partial [Acidobacteriota bacterium]
MIHRVLGTAGHIDHGKTALVRALTGVDTDRLVEEQRRGITIELGFAPLDLGGGRTVGVVDVPGHERFVRTMLAGAGGVDAVLVVIAADESIKPQTREHFDICRLLGVTTGVIALTKIDLVDEELVDVVREEVQDWVAGSFLERAPIVPVSAVTGDGVDELRQAL